MIFKEVQSKRQLVFVVPVYEIADTVIDEQLHWTDGITPLISMESPMGSAYLTAFSALLIEYTFTQDNDIYIALDQMQGMLPGGFDEDGIMGQVFTQCLTDTARILSDSIDLFDPSTDKLTMELVLRGVRVVIDKPLLRPLIIRPERNLWSTSMSGS